MNLPLTAQNKETTPSNKNRPEQLPENPNNGITATTVGNLQEAPLTPPSTTAVLIPTIHQTLTTLLHPPPKPPDLGETQTSTGRI
ncbi:hypothetical protein RHGRI_021355 [Rhododendron griersonianum]|uniref:Uncharacterized protein n=1 Tax=Rhododendron griersonianum TaxID=479676 RepID=A0AAV6JQ94_9ERIC|nr:hypothetical protein RHGRI_021355 [Rhododendron griersonianum]